MNVAICDLSVTPVVLPEAFGGLLLQCPRCGGRFDDVAPRQDGELAWRCSACFFVLQASNGVWKALPSERETYFQRFIQEYENVRAAEGRGSQRQEFYLALPDRDLSGRNSAQWAIRAVTFKYLEQWILPPSDAAHAASLKILDLGAGNGWLSYRLSLRGHQPVAIDLLTNDQDGLAAAVNFQQYLPRLFPRFQAEMDRLPFGNSQFDVAIFNASLHYSEDYERTLREAIRCLRPGGRVIIADTAWYRLDESGQQMVSERRKQFTAQYGFPSDSINSLEYLTDRRLLALENRLRLRWQVHTPFYGWRWVLRPLLAWLQGKRKPSRFRIYVAEVAR